jgi:multidrug efflux pump subunit AcrA (membrane-fusion protein)
MWQRCTCMVTLLCLTFSVVAGCVPNQATPASPTSAPAEETTGTTYVVKRGAVTRELEFDGRIAPVEEYPLYFETSGYVKRVLVQPGELVKAGDLLAELEILQGDGQQSKITLAELDLKSAQVAFAEAVAEAESALALAEQELEHTRALQGTYAGAVAAAQVTLDQAQDHVAQAETEYQEALDRPWELQDEVDAYASTLQQARWGLETAQAQYDQALAAQTAYQHELGMAQTAVEQAEADLKRLEHGGDSVPAIEVERAEWALEWLKSTSRLTAPLDGRVISLSLRPGQLVEPFSTVMIIADPSDVEVSAILSDEELRELSEGQQAIIMPNVDPDRTWDGTVRRLPYPYGTGGSTETLGGLTNPVSISLEGDIGELQLGELVNVAVRLEEEEDALWLPPRAIRDFQGRPFVIVQDDTGQRPVDVEVGVEGETQVEVLSGLEEGQVVVAP